MHACINGQATLLISLGTKVDLSSPLVACCLGCFPTTLPAKVYHHICGCIMDSFNPQKASNCHAKYIKYACSESNVWYLLCDMQLVETAEDPPF